MTTPQPPRQQPGPARQAPPPSPFDVPAGQPPTAPPQTAPPQQGPPTAPVGRPPDPPSGQQLGHSLGQYAQHAHAQPPWPAQPAGHVPPPQPQQQLPQRQPQYAGGPAAPGGPAGTPAQAAGPPPGAPPLGAPYAPATAASTPHLGHALASEWTKIRSLRSTVWTLASMFVVSVGIGMLVGMGFGTSTTMDLPLLSPGVFGLMFGQIGIITLGVLVISSEYSSRMIRTTMTACPRRARVLTAKAIVFFTLAFVITLAATTVTGLINSAILSGMDLGDTVPNEESVRAGELVANGEEWLGATVGASLYVALIGVLALSLGTLLRSAPAAITIMIGVVLMPVVVSFFLLMGGDTTYDASESLREYSPLNGLSSLYRLSMVDDDDATGWPLLGILALVTSALLASAYVRLTRHDV